MNGFEFGRADYLAMANRLAAMRGKFLVSVNDTPFVREAFARFLIEDIPTSWALGNRNGAGKQVTELLIAKASNSLIQADPEGRPD